MSRLHLETLDPVLMPVSPADGQKEGKWDVIQCFAFFTQSTQMGVIPVNSQAGKHANLASCATASGACCTHSRFRCRPREQHQIFSSINNEVPEVSQHWCTGTLKGEDTTSTAPMMHVCMGKLCCT